MLGRVQPADRRHQGQVRGHADRRLGVDRQPARRRARPAAADAVLLPERDQRGHRPHRARQVRRSTGRSQDRQIKVYVYNSQNATPDVQAQVKEARADGHPGRHGDRDAHPGRRHLPGLAGPPTPGAAAGAGRGDGEVTVNRLTRVRAAAVRHPVAADGQRTVPHQAPTRAGGPGGVAARRGRTGRRARILWSGVDLDAHRRTPGSSSPCSAPTAWASPPWSRRSSGCCRSAEGEVQRARRPRRAGPATAIGYLPQRRSFDPGLRIRGVDIVRLGWDGDRWGVAAAAGRGPPAPRGRARGSPRSIELVGASALRAPADRAVLRRRAAAAADRAGAGAAARGCCCSTSRWTASTCPTRRRSPR